MIPEEFVTAADARKHFADTYGKESYKAKKEYGVTIYSYINSKGIRVYSYNLVRVGKGTGGTFCPQQQMELPKGYYVKCVIHTHAGYSYEKDYSKADKTASNNMGVDWYLLLDNGEILPAYKPNTWEEPLYNEYNLK